MIKNRESAVRQPMLIGVFLLSLLLLTISVTTLLFFFRISITIANIPIAVLCSMAVCYFLSGRTWKATLICIGVGIAVTVFAVVLNCYTFDWSWDGNAYHKVMTGFLKYGWNPLYETFYSFADNNFPLLSDFDSNYLDAYPKGTEIWGACVYVFTNNIESAKSFNLLGGVATLLISYELIHRAVGLTRIQAALCALFLSIHPVMLSQMFTQYNDAFLWHMVLLCIMGCLYLTFFERGKYTSVSYFLIFSTINIGFNTKFSGVIYFAIPCASLFVYWVVTKIREGISKTGKKILFSRFYLFAISVLSGCLFNGATSYVVNTIRHRNPFYSIFGDGSNEIITSLMPGKYKEMSNLSRFITSLFSRTGITEEKLPLTFAAEEIHYAKGYDTSIGGWGMLFSGILLISIVVLVIAYVDYRKTKPKICRIAEIFLATGIFAVIVVPGLSWARYCVAPLYIPVCAMMYLFEKSNRTPESFQMRSFGAGVLSALLLVNISPNLVKTDELFEEYKDARYELKRLQMLAEEYDISVSCYDQHFNYNFRGQIFTLYDIGMNPIHYDPQVSMDPTGKIHKTQSIYYKVNNGVLATQTLRDFMEEAQKLDNVMIIIAAKDEASSALTDEIVAVMKKAGLEFDLKEGYRNAYVAVVDDGKVIHEEMAEATLSHSLVSNNEQIEIVSSGYGYDNCASITINGRDCALNLRGLNIVLLDKSKGVVLDSVAVDTFYDNQLTR